ncbi:MAG TPA: ABC transporter ATP-binding protein [Fimbriimonadaceae bacterium]|nr:ABC transporter ATP-binding protein [Fimbriimonadaceae bacterium]
MNATAAIEIRELRKEFMLSHSGINSLKTMLTWWRKRKVERLEVLKGISLDVQSGECVAVVGRNGAGKSTLLSLLARVYKPTSGTVTVHGRVAPLLELGAGFHPDLTGVENIFFNGVILGLTRSEIQERLETIIDFSELRSHIDTPVRTYSSGMLARLGFSIAVNIGADILLVDEVLAVGDLEFERKCYTKIDELRAAGATILFVSHHLESIRRVADRCVWLKDGLITQTGDPESVLAAYVAAAGGEVPELP